MRFILTGFTQDTGFRVFTFEGVGPDQTRTGFSVGTDLALSRRYGIRMQELPLLCREFLERCSEGEQARTFTFTEAEMLVYANRCEAERQARPKRNSTFKPSLRQEEGESPAVTGSGDNLTNSPPSLPNGLAVASGSAAKTEV
jgi:hypothetical protein